MRTRGLNCRGIRSSHRKAIAAAVDSLFRDTFTGSAGALSAHTADSGHAYANNANYGSPTGLSHFALDGSGNLVSTGGEATAAVTDLAMPTTHKTAFTVNIPAYSNMWFDVYMNTTSDGNNRIYFDHVFSDATHLEIGGMVVGGGAVKANNFGSPWHVVVNFGVDMVLRYEVTPTAVSLYVDNTLVGTMTYEAGSVSAAGTLIIDGDTQTNLLFRKIEMLDLSAPPPAITWDAATVTDHITLSNGNLTASCDDANWEYGAKGSATFPTDRKFYIEFTPHFNQTPDWAAVSMGFAPNGWTPDIVGNDLITKANASVDGFFYYGGGFTPNADTGRVVYSDEVLGLAVDPVAGKGWFRNAAGFDGDPVAGTNPRFTFTPGTALVAALAIYNDADDSPAHPTSATLNVGASAFAYTPPSGFTAP